MLKGVIHVNFADAARQEHGLNNIENILKAEPQAQLEVVIHGEGIALAVKNQSRHAEQLARLAGSGVRFVACENTMEKKSIAREDLLPGVQTVPSGAVEILRKQQDGYGYFKP